MERTVVCVVETEFNAMFGVLSGCIEGRRDEGDSFRADLLGLDDVSSLRQGHRE